MSREFQVGVLVRFRDDSPLRYQPEIDPNEIGKVTAVEPDPPLFDPVHRIEVTFSRMKTGWIMPFHFKAVQDPS